MLPAIVLRRIWDPVGGKLLDWSAFTFCVNLCSDGDDVVIFAFLRVVYSLFLCIFGKR